MSKTKAELEAEIRALRKEPDAQSKQEQYDKMGEDVYGVYQGLVNAGFKEDVALELLKISMTNANKR